MSESGIAHLTLLVSQVSSKLFLYRYMKSYKPYVLNDQGAILLSSLFVRFVLTGVMYSGCHKLIARIATLDAMSVLIYLFFNDIPRVCAFTVLNSMLRLFAFRSLKFCLYCTLRLSSPSRSLGCATSERLMM